MGVVNVTPDSFSDGGRWIDADDAIAHGFELVDAGADIVDVGGESTRPGAMRVDPAEEARRVVPVVTALAAQDVIVSVDTMRADVAARAIEAGASLINDVSGGRADPAMLRVAAESGLPFVVMHWRAHSDKMQQSAHTDYDDVVDDVVSELLRQVDDAIGAGIDETNVIVDPGLGFSKTGDQNWTVLKHLDAFVGIGHRVLVAASRKGFLGQLLAEGGVPRDVLEREDATAAVSALAAFHGAWCVRVHDVGRSLDAVKVAQRWNRG